MPQYEVRVCRTGYGFRTFIVTADTLEEAESIVWEDAGNHTYSEKDADYALMGGREITDNG